MIQLNIKTRLALLVSALLALLILSSYSTVHHVDDARDTLRDLYKDRVVPLKQLKMVADAYAIGMVDAGHKVRDGAITAEAGIKTLSEARQQIDTNWKAFVATELTDDERVLIAKALPLMKQADQAAEKLLGLMKDGAPEALHAFTAKEMYPAIDPIGDVVNSLVQVQLDVAAHEYEASEAETVTVLWSNVLMATVAVLAAGLLAWRLIRSIVKPLAQAVKVAEAVANGDLSQHIDVRSHDETGQLLAALKRMNEGLVVIVGQVRSSSDSIATGSAQIANGNADLSQRTEEQASNLQQTAASMEQLAATVKHNADTARAANELASSASGVAAQGGQVVGQVVATMEQITEASRRIADIIGVIDGIAFQTNILALNAAVEAARAGEQGRGFAVVAGEVRSLAQRSAQAAKEIKSLIGDSVDKVEAGSQLAGDAGRTMQDIVAQVRRVTDLIAEISAASLEQSQGIDQIGNAVAQLDQVTQQNAALVEESAAAAESLKQQAARMNEVVSAFRLD
ncbi:MAG TPA: methyl-accepting chemotaxis protein [Ideonella sp.]|uniref:methyl-accepting chemotaxis protein n=1 Tax=Ideonella sp. TaxID=1929293 RepID=UPI002E34A419|nr:methyl-accepting chemotaxis protein [Ideonella sp.]HEX5685914.1 methyl-accepting chemotaxis protein [Ideonella sp.]